MAFSNYAVPGSRLRYANALCRIAYVLAVLSLGGCIANYRAFDSTGGYSEVELSENMFVVSFYGGRFTSSSKLDNFILLRSAEITLQNGHHYFSFIHTPGWERLLGGFYAGGGVDIPEAWRVKWYHDSDHGGWFFQLLFPFLLPKAHDHSLIITFEEQPGPIAYEASSVVQSVKTKYGIKKDDTP